ncbi:WD repeat domain 21 isoform X4 [Narcine bancroftii]|uniref:WD repeat domain 21 isoform X4 n=1 Tax=Narcine bancroftii TaxID=1343680 RepID=UPI0038317570
MPSIGAFGWVTKRPKASLRNNSSRFKKWKDINSIAGGRVLTTVDRIKDDTESIIVTGTSSMTLENRLYRIVPVCRQVNQQAALQCHLMFLSFLDFIMIKKKTDTLGYYPDITIVTLLLGRQFIKRKWKKSELRCWRRMQSIRLVHELKISRMRRNKLKIQHSDSSSTSQFGMILADTNCERIFVVKNDKTGYKYGIVNLEGCGKGSSLISVSMCDNLYSTFRKGTSVCWASLTGHDSHILLCLTGHADTPGSISLLPTSIFSNSSMEEHPRMLCNFKSSTVRTCAWCFNPQADKCFSSGLLHRVFVTDAVTGQKQTFSTSSDVLAQQFARRVPVLYNGCRNGEIFSIDIRQRAKKGQGWKCSRFFHNSTVTSVRLLQDENYLMAADMIGKIKLWDLRTARCVRQYEGHHNKHAHLPIHINEDVGILLAVGQDHYTRIWSLKDGCLLRTIPSPHSGSNDSIPSVVFSSQLGGSSGVPGLLMAVKQDLYHYIYNTDL